MWIPEDRAADGWAPRARRAAFLHRCLWLVVAWLPACAPYQALEIPEREAHTLPSRQEKEGLTVAVRIFLHPSGVDRYYGPELWDAGYFPVVVCLENRGDNTFEIRQDQFRIWLESAPVEGDAAQLRPRPLADMLGTCRQSTAKAYFLLPLLVLPAIWAHHSIEEYNYDLAGDLQAKALPGYYRIEPGDPPLQGSIFFARPEGLEDLAEYLESAELWLDVKIEGERLDDVKAVSTKETSSTRKVGESITFILSLSGAEES